MKLYNSYNGGASVDLKETRKYLKEHNIKKIKVCVSLWLNKFASAVINQKAKSGFIKRIKELDIKTFDNILKFKRIQYSPNTDSILSNDKKEELRINYSNGWLYIIDKQFDKFKEDVKNAMLLEEL